jgi:hypothetical protein
MRTAKRIVAFAVAIGLCGNAMSSENHSTTLYLQRVMRGGVLIDKPRTAIALARVFIEDLYGHAELQRQEPLAARDEAKEWVVEGSFNSGKTEEGMGSVRIVINKFDGQLIDATLPYIMFSHKSRK